MSLPIHAYVPPVDDQLHALEVAGAGHIHASQFGLIGDGTIKKEDLKPFISAAGEFAAAKWAHTNALGDKGQVTWVENKEGYNETHFGPDLKKALEEYVIEGYTSVAGPAEYGGMGAPKAVSMTLTEIFNSANMGLSLGPLLSEAAVEALELCANENVKNMFMERLIAGENFGTMLLTESDSGTALEKVKVSAAKNEDGTYNLNGQKIFITFGEHDASENIIHMVLARTGSMEQGTKGLSLFAVPKYMVDENGAKTEKRNGIESIELHEKMGIHSSPTHVMELGGDKGPAVGYLVGKEGEGMKNMFIMMNNARQRVGISSVGLAERALQAGIRYSAERKQGNDIMTGEKDIPTIRHPNQREDVLISHAKIMASRMICYHAATMSDLAAHNDNPDVQQKAYRMAGLFTPVAKSGSTKMGYEVATTALEMTGGYGFMEESGFSQYVRDAMIPKIYEGTNAIQEMDLMGRKLLHDRGATMMQWIAESKAELKKISSDHEIFAGALYGLECMKAATEHVLTLGGEGKIDQDMALAETYLNLFDRVAGGVMMARSVLVAGDKEPSPNTEYYIQQARIYADNILPETHGLLRKIGHSGHAVLEANTDHLLNQYHAQMG